MSPHPESSLQYIPEKRILKQSPDAGNLLDIIGSKILVIVVVMDVVAYSPGPHSYIIHQLNFLQFFLLLGTIYCINTLIVLLV